MNHSPLPACLVRLLATAIAAAGLSSLRATNVGQYEKFEASFATSVNGGYSNPYDQSVVDIEGTFTAPSGKKTVVPGFYFQDFTRSGDVTGQTLNEISGSDAWKVRFAPSELGAYTYSVTKKDGNGTVTLGTGSFTGVASTNHGFVQTSGFHLQFADGTPFYPLGVNAPWFQYKTTGHEGSWGDGTYGFDKLLSEFTQYGANAIHLWTCNWDFGQNSPFAQPNCACDGTSNDTLTVMRQPDSWEVDYIINQCHSSNVFVMPILKHRDGQAFTSGDQIYCRYAVARWGYSTTVMAWDTFKESATNVSIVSQYCSNLQAIDPYHHPITASEFNHYAETNNATFQQVFDLSSIAIVQDHDYSNECLLPYQNDDALYEQNLMMTSPTVFRTLFDKPSFFGETGVHPCAADGSSDVGGVRSAFYESDTQARILRGDLWGEFMATMGAFAPWYYHIDTDGNSWTNMTAFTGISSYAKAIPAGALTDAAELYSSYTDSSQASTSDSRLQAIGRKTTSFALLRVMNTTGTWASILRDGNTPTPLAGSVTLHNMAANNGFQAKWYDPTSGSLIGTTTASSGSTGDLTVPLPQALSEDVAAIITNTGVQQCAIPAFSPAAGSYASPQSVTITTTTGGAALRYTTDGSAPTETHGTVYTSPVAIGVTTTLKAIAYESGFTDSTVKSGTYTITGGTTDVISIDAGGTATGDFVADEDFSGGTTGSITASVDTSHVTDPAPLAVYQTRRNSVAPATFTYTITGLTANSAYNVRLHFNEHAKSGVGQREFDVTINSQLVLSNFDIFAAAGGKNIANVQTIAATSDASGKIAILFSPGAADNPLINGIELEH